MREAQYRSYWALRGVDTWYKMTKMGIGFLNSMQSATSTEIPLIEGCSTTTILTRIVTRVGGEEAVEPPSVGNCPWIWSTRGCRFHYRTGSAGFSFSVSVGRTSILCTPIREYR